MFYKSNSHLEALVIRFFVLLTLYFLGNFEFGASSAIANPGGSQHG
jgi:hypothetical protein